MTHQYTKLADALEIIAFHRISSEYPQAQDDLQEAARILRAADAVDVQGLMALFVKAANARASWMETSFNRADAEESEAALESALRLALAARDGKPIETAPQADKLLRDILLHDTARTTFYKLENGQGVDTDEGRAWLAAKAWNTSALKEAP